MGDMQLPLSDAFNLFFSSYRLSTMSRIILISIWNRLKRVKMLGEEQCDEFNPIQRTY
jgi:hypothetical protein